MSGNDGLPMEMQAPPAPAAGDWPAMLDSAHPQGIPDSTPLVAGYVDGDFEWSPEQFARFERSLKITVEPFDPSGRPTGYPFGDYRQASIIDVESGAFSLASARRFVPARDHLHPGTAKVYCNKFTYIQQGRRALLGLEYKLWVAWFIDRVPTQADVDALLAELRLPQGVELWGWQHTDGDAYDTSAVFGG